MISNRLFSNIFNFKFFKETFKQHYYILAVCALIFGGILLFPIISFVDTYLNGYNQEYILNSIGSSLQSDNRTLAIYLIFLAIIVPNMIFKYLHSKKQIDLFHSIPVSRTTLFFNNYIIGLLLIIPSYLITLSISYLYVKANIPTFNLSAGTVAVGAIINLVLFILTYNISVISSILTGNTFISIALSCMLIASFDLVKTARNLLIDAFYEYTSYYDYSGSNFFNNSYFSNLFGFRQERLYYSDLTNDSITLKFINSSVDNYNYNYFYIKDFATMLAVYALFAVVLLAVASFLYKKRGSESASNCLSFEISKPIFKYLGVVIFSIIGSMLVKMSFYNPYALYISLVLLVILLHCTIEAIYNFDFKSLFNNFKHLIGCLIISLFIVVSFEFDIFNIDKKVPDVSEIKSAELLHIYNDSYSPSPTPVLNINMYGTISLETEEALTHITDFHKTALGLNPDITTNTSMYETNITKTFKPIRIQYTLKNGSTLTKIIDPNMESIPYLESLIDSQEYLDTAIIFNDEYLKSYTVDYAIILDKKGSYSNFNNLDKDLLNDFIQVLRSDINQHGLAPSNNVSHIVNNLYLTPILTDGLVLNSYSNNYNNEYSYGSSTAYTKAPEAEGLSTQGIPHDSSNITYIYVYDEYTNTLDFIKNNLDFTILDLDKQSIFLASLYYYGDDGVELGHNIQNKYNIELDDNTILNLQHIIDNSEIGFNNFSSYQTIYPKTYGLLRIYFDNFQTIDFIITEQELIDFALDNF